MVDADKPISNLPFTTSAVASHVSSFPIIHSRTNSPFLRKSNPAVLNIHKACLQSASIPASHLRRHKHDAHILTSVQIERGLSQAGSHDLSDTGSLVNGHPPAGKEFKVLYCLMTLTLAHKEAHAHLQPVYCPGGRRHQRLSFLLLSHIHPLFLFLSLEKQKAAKHASLQFNPCLNPLVL